MGGGSCGRTSRLSTGERARILAKPQSLRTALIGANLLFVAGLQTWSASSTARANSRRAQPYAARPVALTKLDRTQGARHTARSPRAAVIGITLLSRSVSQLVLRLLRAPLSLDGAAQTG